MFFLSLSKETVFKNLKKPFHNPFTSSIFLVTNIFVIDPLVNVRIMGCWTPLYVKLSISTTEKGLGLTANLFRVVILLK